MHHELATPITQDTARSLRVNDTVTLRGTLFGIRDATQIHMFDRGRKTRFDLAGHAVLHTAPNVRKVERSDAHPDRLCPALRRHYDERPHGALHPAAHEPVRRAARHRKGRPARGFSAGLRRVRAARTSRSSAARPRWRRRGSKRSRTSTSTTSIRSRCGGSASTASAPCSLQWIATATASIPGSRMLRSSAAPRPCAD